MQEALFWHHFTIMASWSCRLRSGRPSPCTALLGPCSPVGCLPQPALRMQTVTPPPLTVLLTGPLVQCPQPSHSILLTSASLTGRVPSSTVGGPGMPLGYGRGSPGIPPHCLQLTGIPDHNLGSECTPAPDRDCRAQ